MNHNDVTTLSPPLPDADARAQALDITQSFIVQAPAGSGKTTLLVKRYLHLLAYACQHPEEIVAITFTRKAAAQMQSRVLALLLQPQETDAATQAVIHTILKRNHEQKWQLLTQHPPRLSIMTIDALCGLLVQSASLAQTQPNVTYPPTEQPHVLYEAAMMACLLETTQKNPPPVQKALTHLLTRLQQSLPTLLRLGINMLAKRDQWLPYVFSHSSDLPSPASASSLRQHLTQTLAQLRQYTIEIAYDAAQRYPLATDTLLPLFLFAQTHLPANCRLTALPPTCQSAPLAFPPPTLTYAAFWFAFSQFILNKSGSVRKRVNVKNGFPSPNSTPNSTQKARYKENKHALEAALAQLCVDPNAQPLIHALQRLQRCPQSDLLPEQWETLHALMCLLPHCVAHLSMQFHIHQQTDFIHIAHAALFALGEETHPSPLALQLDYRIRHLLVDEFQDTSLTQYRLLEQLTQAWSPDGKNTLFLVGDPMQSIYRFRQADVGLFLRTQTQGWHSVPMTPLALKTNFRSSSTLIHTFNEGFSRCFPRISQADCGAVAYRPSMPPYAMCAPANTSPTTLLSHLQCFDTDAAQYAGIIQTLHTYLADTSLGDIAILVRARSHLEALIPVLHANHIAYCATELNPLSSRPFIKDLLILCEVLLYPHRYLAWLALLRTPWCNANVYELYLLTRPLQTTPGLKEDMLTLLQQHRCDALSPQTQRRLTHLCDTLHAAYRMRHKRALPLWIQHCWTALESQDAVYTQSQAAHYEAQQLLTLLAQWWHCDSPPPPISTGLASGEYLRWQQFIASLHTRYASPPNHTNRIQIMTLHKAKGLEFDAVIIPHLEKPARPQETDWLLWDQFSCTDNSDYHWLIAPCPPKGYTEKDSIYAYLKQRHKEKDQHELTRLLYVGLTRAKTQLALFATHPPDMPARTGSLLAALLGT